MVRHAEVGEVLAHPLVKIRAPRLVAFGPRRHEDHHPLPGPREQHAVGVLQILPPLGLLHGPAWLTPRLDPSWGRSQNTRIL